MSSTNEEDPFLQVQASVLLSSPSQPQLLISSHSDVLSALTSTRPLFTSYLRIRSLSSVSSTPSPELISAKQELESSLSSLAEDLADLTESVKAVQSDPYKYGLEIEEVARRKRLVDEVGGEIEDMREELQKSISNVLNGKGKGRANDSGNGFEDSTPDSTDYNAEFEQQQQLHMMAEQDVQLDSVFHTVGNLRLQADSMGRELEEQAEMLETTDTLADRVGGRLSTGMQKMGTVIRKNEDGLSSCCIAVLIFVLILLLVLVLIL